jgi:chemotaxis family two-component system response regulator Rcp1
MSVSMSGPMKDIRIVLMVDDNPADVDLAREALKENSPRSQVNTVGDGEQAIDFLKRKGIHADQPRPDLVILDLNLPKKDGRAVLAEVKSDPGLHGIPVVIFSTSRLTSDIARSYELGANCYVNKPGNLNEYFAAVKAIEEFWFGLTSLPQRGN